MGEGSGRDLTEGLFFVFLNFFRAASPPVESLGKMRGGGPGEGRRRPFPKGPFSPGFFIYSAYFTILGSSMIW